MKCHPPATVDQFPDGAAQRVNRPSPGFGMSRFATGDQDDIFGERHGPEIRDGTTTRRLTAKGFDDAFPIHEGSGTSNFNKVVGEQSGDARRRSSCLGLEQLFFQSKELLPERFTAAQGAFYRGSSTAGRLGPVRSWIEE